MSVLNWIKCFSVYLMFLVSILINFIIYWRFMFVNTNADRLVSRFIPRGIEESGIGRGGSSDFLLETRGIVIDKPRCENEKYEAKPTLHQNRFFIHERYIVENKDGMEFRKKSISRGIEESGIGQGSFSEIDQNINREGREVKNPSSLRWEHVIGKAICTFLSSFAFFGANTVLSKLSSGFIPSVMSSDPSRWLGFAISERIWEIFKQYAKPMTKNSSLHSEISLRAWKMKHKKTLIISFALVAIYLARDSLCQEKVMAVCRVLNPLTESLPSVSVAAEKFTPWLSNFMLDIGTIELLAVLSGLLQSLIPIATNKFL